MIDLSQLIRAWKTPIKQGSIVVRITENIRTQESNPSTNMLVIIVKDISS